jgi:hypothetical protein
MNDNPYTPPQTAVADAPDKAPAHDRYATASSRALRIAAWAAVLLFTVMSLGVAFPLSTIEAGMADGKIPQLPRMVINTLALRHYWHLFPALALLIALVAQKRAHRNKLLRRWMWAALIILWMLAYAVGSVFSLFYITLLFNIHGRDPRLSQMFGLYVVAVVVVIAVAHFWPWRRRQPAGSLE